MLVSCPSCKEKFKVDESLIGGAGRKVKCSKCGDIWVQTLIPIKDDVPVSLRRRQESQVSSTSCIRSCGKNFYTYISIALFAALLALIYFNFFSLGTDLRLGKVYFFGKDETLSIEYEIINDSSEFVQAPLAIVNLIGTEGKIVKYYFIDHGEVFIKPLSHAKFKSYLPVVPEKINNISLRLGNWLDFLIGDESKGK